MSTSSCPFTPEVYLGCITSCPNYNITTGQCQKNCQGNKNPLDVTIRNETHHVYICYHCYSLCNNCNGAGSDYNMMCTSCKNNYILYQGNCYQIQDSTTKKFYQLGSTTLTTNCKNFGKYIKDNGKECIDMPSGYYVANEETGIISSCHSSCKSCTGPLINNCSECSNGKFFLNGSCLNNCPDGYLSKNGICIKCHKNCLNCDEEAKYDENNLINMGCLECANNTIFIKNNILNNGNCFPIINYKENRITFDIQELNKTNKDDIISIQEESCLYFNRTIFYGEKECLIKQNHTYYILNNENNTGIIQYCDEACESCINGKELNNTNCIECSQNYFKTEESNTNCIFSDLIPKNYYKNTSDNIFYKCYFTCGECYTGYNLNNNNMNCKECINNYYFIEGTNNCYNETILENNKYYLKNDTFYKCYDTCSTCYNFEPNEDNNFCIKCNNNLYLLENTNNCFNISLLEKGFYLDNEKAIEPIFKKCYENCKTCNNYYINNDMNCIQCNDGFYKINGTNNCYNNSLLNKKYYFKNDLFYPCYDTCLECNDSVNNDINSGEKNHNCLKCLDNYNFKFETKNCFNESLLEQGYYLSLNDSMYHQCDFKCKTCYDYSTFNNTNCILCNNDLGYFLAENKPISNCYNNKTIEKNYFLNNINKKWNLCYASCETCSDFGNITFHNCDSCLSKNYFIENTKNCITEEIALNMSLYFDLDDGRFKKCDISCLVCIKDKNYCLKCNTLYSYYPLYKNNTKCYNDEITKKGFYLNKDYELDGVSYFTWKDCYERCETCYSGGNSLNMSCIACKSDLINKHTNKTYYFKLIDTNCIEYCPDNLLLTAIGDCVSICPNNTYEFSLNSTCLRECPNTYKINKFKNKCIKIFDNLVTKEEFKIQMIENIISYVNSSIIINGSDFLSIVLSSEDINPEEQIKLGISGIDLGNCTEIIKEYYNISTSENLIILNIESKNDKDQKNSSEVNNDNTIDNTKSFYLGKNIELKIFDFSGRELNLSYCKEDIKVMKYIGDVDELNIESAKEFSSQGIDVFDARDNYFNDICHLYFNKNNIDIIIKDRRTDIYQNATFCQEGCSYNGINYELMTANCLCDVEALYLGNNNLNNSKNKINKPKQELNFKTITKSFISNLFDFNYEVLKCYNIIFNKKILVNNIGFYCLLIMLILQLIFLCIYIIIKLKKIKHYMLGFVSKKIDDNNKNNIKKDEFLKNNINNNKDLNPIWKNKIEEEYNEKNKDIITVQLQKIRSKYEDCTINNDLNNPNSERILIVDNKNISKNSLNLNKRDNNLLKISACKNLLDKKYNKNLKKGNSIKNNIWAINNIQAANISVNNGTDNETQIYEIKNKNNEIMDSNKQIKKISIEPENRCVKKEKKKIKIKIKKKVKIKIKKKIMKKTKRFRIIDNSQKNQKNNNININNLITIADKENDINNNENKNDSVMDIPETNYELQDMDYSEALIKDKRNYLQIYWGFLVDTQIILGTFFTENYLYLFVIKLSFFVFTFQISFFLNALFYSDEYISDAYHNNGVLDFISGLPKSIYSFIATLITTNLLKMLSNSQSELMKIIKEKGKDSDYINLINNKLSKLRKKLVAYFILIIVLGLFFLYYTSSFCGVYKYSQKYWFLGCLESFGMDSLVSIVICIFLALFRYISIKKQIKYLYVLASIISNFL